MFISNSPAETEAIGERFAQHVEIGSVLALKGELGSGKTLFTKGLVIGLGSSAAVTSPTFTIVHEYPGGRLPIFPCAVIGMGPAGSGNWRGDSSGKSSTFR